MAEGESSSKVKKKSTLDGNPKVDSFRNRDGLLLKTYAWLVQNPIGILILVHGMNSHIQFEYLKPNVEVVSNKEAKLIDGENFYLYQGSWIEQFNKNNFSVYGLDLQGHGQSEAWRGLRSNIKRYDDLVYDVLQFINRVHDMLSLSNKKDNSATLHENINSPNIPPIYIMGFSMGGNIVLRILEILGKSKDNSKVKISGCISLAGMVSIEHLKQKKSYKYFYIPMSKLASNLIPNARITPSLEFEKYPFVNDVMAFDKLKCDKPITCRFGYELLRAVDTLHEDMEHIDENIPLLFIHSKEDSACHYEGVVEFCNKLKNSKKELFTVENMDHMLTMEPGNEAILQKIIEWLTQISKELGSS
ncbi:lysophospholipase, putative [Plasmodium gallinaceum]|uniref:Lysophospholipase, putative n=1 Tax=Plasmodium gallinaceum TaxID=5849 RepID=A0A1J1GZR3_PLAGA|nr:lysophospholipase, putative [Plasmodium gallinaceum]CRG98064.1 lysophospholipase, putative [Plasmodium gallinaceum]